MIDNNTTIAGAIYGLLAAKLNEPKKVDAPKKDEKPSDEAPAKKPSPVEAQVAPAPVTNNWAECRPDHKDDCLALVRFVSRYIGTQKLVEVDRNKVATALFDGFKDNAVVKAGVNLHQVAEVVVNTLQAIRG